MKYKRFVFVRQFNCQYGKIDPNTELIVKDGVIYVNGIMIEKWYYNILMPLIESEIEKPHFLKELPPKV